MTPPASAPTEHRLTLANRTCSSCGQTKPLTAFWLSGGTYRRHECRTCSNARQRDRHALWLDTARTIDLRRLQRRIPPASFRTELDVILVCWDQCRAEGGMAIERLMTRLCEVARMGDDKAKTELLIIVASFRRGGLSLEAARQRVQRVGG